MTTPLKIGIVSPARDIVHTAYTLSLAGMMNHTTAQRPDITIDVSARLGTMIFAQRIKLAHYCLEQRCDYILWLDTDMRFPRDTLLMLLAHQRDIVAANYVTREIPAAPVAAVWTGPDTKWKRVPTLPELSLGSGGYTCGHTNQADNDGTALMYPMANGTWP
jgi:hypothetical protein